MINKIKLIKLKKIKSDKGFIVKSISKFDKYFRGFEELYFSTVKKNNIKGWNYHKKMTCNIIVIKGMIEFIFYCVKRAFHKNISMINAEVIKWEGVGHAEIISESSKLYK